MGKPGAPFPETVPSGGTPARPRPVVSLAASLVLSVGILALLLWQIDKETLRRALAAMSLAALAAPIGLFAVALILNGLRLRVLANGEGRQDRAPWLRLAALHQSLVMLAPGGLGDLTFPALSGRLANLTPLAGIRTLIAFRLNAARQRRRRSPRARTRTAKVATCWYRNPASWRCEGSRRLLIRENANKSYQPWENSLLTFWPSAGGLVKKRRRGRLPWGSAADPPASAFGAQITSGAKAGERIPAPRSTRPSCRGDVSAAALIVQALRSARSAESAIAFSLWPPLYER